MWSFILREYHLVDLLIVSLSGVFLVNALDDWMGRGMIFRSYKYWLTIITLRRKIFKFMYKPLGGCMFCLNVWAIWFSFLCFFQLPGLWAVIFIAVFGHWTLKMLDRYGML